MAEKKKRIHRSDIADASVKRLIKEYGSDMRVSAKAASMVGDEVERYLKQIGTEGARLLKLKKKATLTVPDIEHIVSLLDCKVKRAHTSRRERGLAELGVLRVVRHTLGGDLRIDEGAKKALVAYAEGRIQVLAEDAHLFAKNAGRDTINDRDIHSVLEMRS